MGEGMNWRPSQARINELRGRDLIRRMEDEILELNRAPALKSPLAFVLRTGLPAKEYDAVRALAKALETLLARRIALVAKLAGLVL